MVRAIAMIFGVASLYHKVSGIDSRLWLGQRTGSDSDDVDGALAHPEEATRLMDFIGGLKKVAEAAKSEAAKKASTAAQQTPTDVGKEAPADSGLDGFRSWVKQQMNTVASAQQSASGETDSNHVEEGAKAANKQGDQKAPTAAAEESPTEVDSGKPPLERFGSWLKQQVEKAASAQPGNGSDPRKKAAEDFFAWAAKQREIADQKKAEAAKQELSATAAPAHDAKKTFVDLIAWAKQQAEKRATMKAEADRRFEAEHEQVEAAAAEAAATASPSAHATATDPKTKALGDFVTWVKESAAKRAEVEAAKHREEPATGAAPAPVAASDPAKKALEGFASWVKQQAEKGQAMKEEANQRFAAAQQQAVKAEPVRESEAAKHEAPQQAVQTATPAPPKATEAPAQATQPTAESKPDLLDQLAPWVKDLKRWREEVAGVTEGPGPAAVVTTPGGGKAELTAARDFSGWMGQQKELAAHNAAARAEAEAKYKQLEQQRRGTSATAEAAADTMSTASDLQAWVKQEQEKAAQAAAEAAHEAAKGTAKSAMSGLIGWVAKQGELAAQRAAAKAAETPSEQQGVPKAAEIKTTDIAKAWRDLMDRAKSTAAKTAQEELAKHNAEEPTPSKGSVDASIAEAEKRLEVADTSRQAHAASADAAQKAAKQASERALEDLLKWAESGKQEVKQQPQLLKDSQEVNHTQEVNQTQTPHDSLAGVFDAWENANAAWGKTFSADKAEQAAQDTAAHAAWVADLGHNVSKAIWQAHKPGATKIAMDALQDAGKKAKESLYDSYVAGNDASDVKELFAKAVQAALHTTGSDRISAAHAVARTYGALDRAGKDALMAARHTNDALQAVARATAEVGWRAVSEILAKELCLVRSVAEKVSVAKDLEKFSALAEGLAQAKKVAQIAWFKGLGEGLRRPASAEALGKVAVASHSVANVSLAWIKAVSQAMQTTEAQEAVTKAASMATKAASEAALRVSDQKAKSVQQSLFDVIKGGKAVPWVKAGAEVTTFSNWNKDNGLTADALATVGLFDKLYTLAHINAKPDPTHMNIQALGKAGVPMGPKADVNVRASIATAPGVSSDVQGSFSQSVPNSEPVAGRGSLHAQPIQDAYAINGASVVATKSRALTDTVSAIAANDGRGVGKAHIWARVPEFKEPLEAEFNFAQPFPSKK